MWLWQCSFSYRLVRNLFLHMLHWKRGGWPQMVSCFCRSVVKVNPFPHLLHSSLWPVSGRYNAPQNVGGGQTLAHTGHKRTSFLLCDLSDGVIVECWFWMCGHTWIRMWSASVGTRRSRASKNTLGHTWHLCVASWWRRPCLFRASLDDKHRPQVVHCHWRVWSLLKKQKQKKV